MTYSSSTYMTRRSGYSRRHQNSVSFTAQTGQLGPVSNTIILIVLACLIGLLYLTQVTKTNSYGYKINDLQKQSAQLKEERANLEISAARLSSLQRVKNSAVASNLVSVAPSGTISN